MPLSSFFEINLPYGLKKNDKGEWIAFNREYLPLGHTDTGIILEGKFNIYTNINSDLVSCTKYYGLTEKRLLELAVDLKRDEEGNIHMIWLYRDSDNTVKNKNDWNMYLEKLTLLSKIKRKDSYL